MTDVHSYAKRNIISLFFIQMTISRVHLMLQKKMKSNKKMGLK